MKKDIDKILSRTLSTYVFILFLIFILKIVGLDYFGISINNPTMIKLESLFKNLYLRDILYFSLIMVYQYLMLSIICDDNSKKIKIYTIMTIPFTLIIQYTKDILIQNFVTAIIELVYLYVLSIIYNKVNKINKMKLSKLTIRFIFVITFNIIIQFLSSVTRYKYQNKYINDFIPNIILNLDYLIMLLICYKLWFMKGVDFRCIFQVEAGSSSQKQTLSLKQLKKYLAEFSNKNKQEKFEIILFTILSLLWNIFTVFVVLLIAKLNDTVIECIFILSSFWINKTVFGKAFHLDNAFHCFIVSNLTYYCLNRITAPIGISILIPIILGILLSYFTSKLVKDNKSKLYRGMPTDLFDEIILKVVNKNDIDYKICYMYYIEKIKEENIAYKVNYSKEAIQKHKKSVNDKIKRLVF